MTQSPLAAVLADLAAPLAASIGLELWGIELVFGGRTLARIFVDSENGVSIDQCAELSRLLGLSLDVEDIIPGAYVLEVSSPGLERTFFTGSQLACAVGLKVEIILHQPQDAWPGRKKFRGLLWKAPETAPAAEHTLLPDSALSNASSPDAPKMSANEAENRDGLFFLRIEDLPHTGDEAPVIAFAFADVKKASQIHSFPEPALPGKASGKKKRNKP
jgi:ribosome maturation factor RimP